MKWLPATRSIFPALRLARLSSANIRLQWKPRCDLQANAARRTGFHAHLLSSIMPFSSRRAARCFSQLHGQQGCHSAFRLPSKQTCRCSPDDRPAQLCTRPSRGVELPESSEQPPALQSWQLDQSAKALGFAAALCTALLLVPNSADAAEALPLDILAAFLVCVCVHACRDNYLSKWKLMQRLYDMQAKVQALGPWGPCLFVLTVICCEMIPLFPTQPLALSSGLLFGPYEVRSVPRSWALHCK